MAGGIAGAEFRLYHNANLKLATTSTGIDVTGTVTADGLTSSAVITAQEGRSNTAGTGQIVIDPDDTTVSAAFRLDQTDNKLNIDMTNGGAWQKKLSVYTGGDISFYEDTGTTPKLFWDASAESLGIGGTTSPSDVLELTAGSTNFGLLVNNATGNPSRLTLTNSEGSGYIDQNNNLMRFNQSGAVDLAIDSSGNVLVGKSSENSNTAGIELHSNDLIKVTRSGGATAYLNRQTNDGDLITFAKDGTTIGAFGVESSDQVYFSRDTGSQGIKLKNGAAMPCNADGTDSDDDQDLGSSSVRWKDGYFSRDLIVGDQILHDGDGDTYLQFHNANEFRIVTGGTEMLEVNDSTVQLGATLDANGNNLDNVEDIYLRDKLFHDGDTGNNIEFETGYIKFNHDSSVRFYFDQYGLWNEGTYWDDYEALSGTSPTIDVDTGGAFSLTMSGNTTFTFANPQFNNYGGGFVLQLTGNGGTVTWPNSVDWAGGTAPDAPANGETDILVFWTRDQGTTWYGVLSVDAAA
jgi:hypothetical protein